MAPLNRLAWQYNVAIVLVHHFNKSGQVAGSAGIVEAARHVIEVKVKGRLRQLTVRKTNLIDHNVTPVYYVITGDSPFSHIEWITREQAECVLRTGQLPQQQQEQQPQKEQQPEPTDRSGQSVLRCLGFR